MNICKNKRDCAKISAGKTAEIIVKAIRRKGFSNIIVSAGISQYQMLHELSKADIEWRKVNVFQLDDYVGIPRNHPASFGKFLMDSFDSKIRNLKRFTYINGDASPEEECRRLGRIISRVDIDVACIGIGENGHLGFNDPPADFKIDKPYITVG
ncbi:MAG: 6-phosphogluconolactonase, partial [Candidatus Paceibacterota bacterium]